MDDQTQTVTANPTKQTRRRKNSSAPPGSNQVPPAPQPPDNPPQPGQLGSQTPRPASASGQRGYRPGKPLPEVVPTENDPSGSKPAPRSPISRSEALQILADRANRGSKESLAHLRQALDQNPEIWTHIGDLSRLVETAWLDLISGGDHLIIESVKRRLAHMKAQLAGRQSSASASLLVEELGCNWLELKYCELDAAKSDSASLGVAMLRLRRAESVQKRYLATMKTLAMIRTLLPQGLTPPELPSQPDATDQTDGDHPAGTDSKGFLDSQNATP
jgi:hypothetical protein